MLSNRRLARLALPATLLLVLAYLVARNHGLYPAVFADEWSYSRYARLAPMAEALVPSYLYLALFKLTSACGAGFLDCARIGNAALFVLSGPFIYRVALPLAGRGAAIVITAASLLAGVNSYTAYFMPEPMYFLCFWVLTWVVLTEAGGIGLAGGLLTGAVLGLMSLVKVHALFLLPALVPYALWRGWRDARLPAAVAAALAIVLATLAVKSALGWLLAGPAGLELLGSFYGSHASNKGGASLTRLLAPMLWNLYGHAMALMLLFAVPLLAAAAAAASPAARLGAGQPGRNALVYLLLTLGATLGMTVAYTASIADAGPLEGSRLHLRYYDFVFPLLAMVAASPVLANTAGRWRRLALALPAAALLAYAACHLRPDFALSFVDGPELANLATDGKTFHRLCLLQGVVIALWCWRPALGRPLFVWLLLPLLAVNSEQMTGLSQLGATVAEPADRAGLAMRSQLTAAQRDRLLMVGDEGAALPRAQFHVDSDHAQIMPLPAGAPFEANLLPRGVEHLLVLGRHALPPELAPQVVTPDYTLTHLPPARVVRQVMFSLPARDDTLTGFDGLAEREPWGSWSNGKRVALHFSKPLPRAMTVFLNASAFGPNVDQEFVLRVGGQARRFKLPGRLSEHTFRLNSDGLQHTLVIDVPHAVSPRQLGMGDDTRELGMALIYLEVGEVVAPANTATTN